MSVFSTNDAGQKGASMSVTDAMFAFARNRTSLVTMPVVMNSPIADLRDALAGI